MVYRDNLPNREFQTLMNTSSSDHSGIYFMLLGMFLFTVNDAIGKWLVMDFSVGQLLAIRSWAALVILFPLLAKKGELVKLFQFENPKLHCIRLFFVVMEASCFFWAVRYLPLADTFMIYLAAPIFVTALSPFMLGEKVGIFRWMAVLTGFGGVVLIFPPSEAALSLPAFVAVAGSLGLAFVLILTRKLREADPVRLITLQTLAMAVAASFTLPVVWIAPNGFEFMLFCLLGLVATTAHFLINHAVRTSPAIVVAPFQYSAIIWAMILGYFFWNDIPTSNSLIGAGIVVSSGLFILYREAKQK